MAITEILKWAGLVSFVLGCVVLSIIAARNSVWFAPHRSLLQELRPLDKKLGKIAILLIGLSGVLFATAGIL